MANVPSSHRPQGSERPAGTRFRTQELVPVGARPQRSDSYSTHTSSAPQGGGPRPAGARFAQPQGHSGASHTARPAVQPAYSRNGARPPKKNSAIPMVIGVIVAIAIVVFAGAYVFPRMFGSSGSTVEAGQAVTVSIPDGSSGDAIASILSENHVIEDPSEYYAAVKKLGAEMSLKPGDYQFTTLQDPLSVVKQLVEGPNASGAKLTVPEGKTVNETAQIVEQVYGIPASEFMAQAKASSYATDYPFLQGVQSDSLEGFLYPKTYTFTNTPTADQVIRAMLDQYRADVLDVLDFDSCRAAIASRFGVELTDYEVLILASVAEREGLNADQYAHVAAVFYNRLAGKGDFAGRPHLESDATLMYETGGTVTADDIQNIDSPYNSYKYPGLPPTPICSPSVTAINAALNPLDSDDLYFYITPNEEYFSQTYDEHMKSWE